MVVIEERRDYGRTALGEVVELLHARARAGGGFHYRAAAAVPPGRSAAVGFETLQVTASLPEDCPLQQAAVVEPAPTV